MQRRTNGAPNDEVLRDARGASSLGSPFWRTRPPAPGSAPTPRAPGALGRRRSGHPEPPSSAPSLSISPVIAICPRQLGTSDEQAPPRNGFFAARGFADCGRDVLGPRGCRADRTPAREAVIAPWSTIGSQTVVANLAAGAVCAMRNPGGFGPAGVRLRRFGGHLDVRLAIKRVKPAQRSTDASSGPATLVVAGYDADAATFAAIELLDGGWFESRFAFDDILKARGYKRKKRRSHRRHSSRRPDDGDLTFAPSPAQRLSPHDSPSETQTAGHRDAPSRGPPAGGGRRGVITTMTDAQRRTLRDRIRAAAPSLGPRLLPSGRMFHPASFLSLTYPGRRGWNDRYLDPHLWKRHLRAFWRRVIRRHADTWVIWVLELQYRDEMPDLPPAWHFHLLVRWPDDLAVDWAEFESCLSKNWSEVVCKPRRPPSEHVQRGASARPVETPHDLADYFVKAGTKHSLPTWISHGGPFLPDDESERSFASRVARVRRAIRRYRINTNQGAWSRTLNTPGYRKSCSVYAVEIPPELAGRLRLSIGGWWKSYFDRRGIAPQSGFPKWITGDEAARALQAGGVTARELLSGREPGEVINVTTGEPDDPSSCG